MKSTILKLLICLNLVFVPFFHLQAQSSITRSNIWTWEAVSNFVVSYTHTYFQTNIFNTPSFPSYLLTTNAFPGPTNTLDMSLSAQLLSSASATAVTNLSNVSSNMFQGVSLYLTNSESTNWSFFLTAPGIITQDGKRSWLVTNGHMAIVTFYNYGQAFTNSAHADSW